MASAPARLPPCAGAGVVAAAHIGSSAVMGVAVLDEALEVPVVTRTVLSLEGSNDDLEPGGTPCRVGNRGAKTQGVKEIFATRATGDRHRCGLDLDTRGLRGF